MRPKADSPLMAYKLVMESWNMDKIDFVEQFKVLLLNRAGHVLGLYELATGGIGGVLIDPRLIYVSALKTNASGIILFHNHPSGNLKASDVDLELTQALIRGATHLDLMIVDHISVTSEGYFSFGDRGGITPYAEADSNNFESAFCCLLF